MKFYRKDNSMNINEMAPSKEPFVMKNVKSSMVDSNFRVILFKTSKDVKFQKLSIKGSPSTFVKSQLNKDGDAISTFNSGALVSIGITGNKFFVNGVKLTDYQEFDNFDSAWKKFEVLFNSRDTYKDGMVSIPVKIDYSKLTDSEKKWYDDEIEEENKIKKRVLDWFDKIRDKNSKERKELEEYINSKKTTVKYYDSPERDTSGNIIPYVDSKAFNSAIESARKRFKGGHTKEEWDKIEDYMREFASKMTPIDNRKWTLKNLFGAK